MGRFLLKCSAQNSELFHIVCLDVFLALLKQWCTFGGCLGGCLAS